MSTYFTEPTVESGTLGWLVLEQAEVLCQEWVEKV